MKKICAVISSLELGGAELSFKAVVNMLAKSECKVHVITLFGENEQDDFLKGVTSESLGLTTRGKSLLGKIKTIRQIVQALRSALKRESPEQVFSFMTQTNLLLLYSLPKDLHTSILVAERVHPEYAPILQLGLLKPLMRCSRNYLYRKADNITVQSESMVSVFPKDVQSKISVIPNALRSFDSDNSVVEKKKTILTVGRLVPQKDQQLLLRAFGRIANDFPDWSVTVLGSGYLKDSLFSIANNLGITNRVNFLEKTEKIASLYRTAEIFTLTSTYEGFPNVLLEAMSFSLPVIATDCPGASRELVSNGDNGYLIAIGDEVELSRRLSELIESPQLRSSFGEKSLLRSKDYSSDKILNKWRDLLVS